MTSMLNPSRDRTVTLCALEVLNLIADRVELHGTADSEDITSVLQYFRNIAHACLGNTEKHLLLPYTAAEINAVARDRVGTRLENHRQADGLLNELEQRFLEGKFEEFVAASRRYVNVLGHLMAEERHFFPTLVTLPTNYHQIQQMLSAFDEAENTLALQARAASGKLRQLELKYVSPHCI